MLGILLIFSLVGHPHGVVEADQKNSKKKLDLMPHWHVIEEKGIPKKTLESKESEVSYRGRKYRRIEVDNDTFYVRFDNAQTSPGNEEILCGQDVTTFDRPALAEAAFKVSKRSRVYIEGLRKICNSGRNQEQLSLDPHIGVSLGTNKDHESKKSTKIYANPLDKGFGIQKGF